VPRDTGGATTSFGDPRNPGQPVSGARTFLLDGACAERLCYLTSPSAGEQEGSVTGVAPVPSVSGVSSAIQDLEDILDAPSLDAAYLVLDSSLSLDSSAGPPTDEGRQRSVKIEEGHREVDM
jgi:hypothetical protein